MEKIVFVYFFLFIDLLMRKFRTKFDGPPIRKTKY